MKVTCVISLLVGALYNIVDQIFIANANYLGSYGNAANTVVMSLASSRRICRRTLLLGITSFLSQISLVAAMAAINNMLRKYGAVNESGYYTAFAMKAFRVY